MKITLIPPFPTGEGGRGDRGQKSKLKAWLAGDKEGKPPRRAPKRQGEQVPPGFSPPAGTTAAGIADTAAA